jgi:hypothetical protein
LGRRGDFHDAKTSFVTDLSTMQASTAHLPSFKEVTASIVKLFFSKQQTVFHALRKSREISAPESGKTGMNVKFTLL